MLDEAETIADEGIQGAVKSQPARFKDVPNQSRLMQRLRKRKRIDNKNRTRTNINNNNNNNNSYTTLSARRRPNLARGTSLAVIYIIVTVKTNRKDTQ